MSCSVSYNESRTITGYGCEHADCCLRLDDFCCHYETDQPVLPCSGVKYGFTLAVLEGPNTIPTLWDATQDFMGELLKHCSY